MKTCTIQWFGVLALCSLLFIACDDEENNVSPVDTTPLQEALLTFPESNFEFALDKDNSTDVIRFEWEAPNSEDEIVITYEWVLDTENGDFSDPLLRIPTLQNGTDTFAEISYETIDLALSAAGFSPDEIVALQWGVEATSTGRTSIASQTISLQRFELLITPETLYLAGNATETGPDVTNSLLMNRLKRADGSSTNIFELYTSLQAGNTYNFYSDNANDATVFSAAEDRITTGDEAIEAPETGIYRITVNFNTELISLYKIDEMNIIGNVIPGIWFGGADATMQYQGNGVWNTSIKFIDGDSSDPEKRFIFRANRNFDEQFQSVAATNEIVLLEQALETDIGYSNDDLFDIPVSLAFYEVTLTLNGNGYSYTLEEKTVDTAAPDRLFLFADGVMIEELSKNGDTFATAAFHDLIPETMYTLNTEADHSGVSYSITNEIGENDTEFNIVNWDYALIQSSSRLRVRKNRAYKLEVRFGLRQFNSKYYNFRFGHWGSRTSPSAVNIDFGSVFDDSRFMTYIGNFTWEFTDFLYEGLDSKFYLTEDVPNGSGGIGWIDLGGVTEDGLTGDLQQGGANLKNITQDGNYVATLFMSNNLNSDVGASYSFELQ